MQDITVEMTADSTRAVGTVQPPPGFQGPDIDEVDEVVLIPDPLESVRGERFVPNIVVSIAAADPTVAEPRGVTVLASSDDLDGAGRRRRRDLYLSVTRGEVLLQLVGRLESAIEPRVELRVVCSATAQQWSGYAEAFDLAVDQTDLVQRVVEVQDA